MNAYDNNAQVDALSDNELDAASGGRHQVAKEQYEILLAVRMAVAKGAGLSPLFPAPLVTVSGSTKAGPN